MGINQNSSKTLVVIKANQDHANRLFQSIYFEALCMEHGIRYVNNTFKNMAEYYEGCAPCPTFRHFFGKVLSSKRVGRFLMKFGFSKEYFSLLDVLKKLYLIQLEYCYDRAFDNTDAIMAKFKQSMTVFVLGGGCGAWSRLVEKYRDYFIHKYRLKEKYYKGNTMLDKILELKKCRTVVGVHMRRGDYKEWGGGIYYFDDAAYLKIISNVKQIIPSECGFVIFSNDVVPFDEDEYLLISKEPWHIDHYLMAQCDYLIGPPSTFSSWASFISGVKCFHVSDPNQEIRLDDFIVFKS